MKTLTTRQYDILCYIKGFIDGNGYSPSVRDVSVAFGDISTNAVKGHLDALEKKNYIERQPRLARSIILTGKKPRVV